MTKKILAVLLLSLLPGPASAAPKLLVVVVVDQMRAAYLAPTSGAYTGGLARLQREGFVFEDARHVHVPTDTGPGHAAVMTGRFPDTTGIVGNDWYDRALATDTYCAADSVFGRGPEHLWGYTLGDALKGRHPESRVVTVSVKDRAAIFMGGKKADAALWYDPAAGAFTTSGYYERPSWLDKFNRRLREKGEPLHDATTPAFYDDIMRTPEGDRLVLELALEAARRFKLGRGDQPDVLGVSFSATDKIGHRYDADSPQMAEQLRRLDLTLGELLEGLEKRVGAGKVDVVLTADHGAPPHARRERMISFAALDDAIERALRFDYPAAKPWIVSEQFPHLYLNRAQARALGVDWRVFLKQAAARLSKLDGIAAAYLPDDLDPSDPYYAQYKRGAAPGRAGDIMLRPQPGVMVDDAPDILNHGAPYDDDARVPLVFWGPDFKTGRSTETAKVADLASTAAAALGFEFKPRLDSVVLPALK